MKWVRPVISIIAMLGITYGFFVGKVATDTYVLIAGGAIAWWFKSRDDEKKALR